MSRLLPYIKQPLFNDFYITRLIGQGTYSEVYEVTDGHETAVIKVKPVFADSPESLQRKMTVAEREAVIMDCLKDCPYIVRYHGKVIQKISDLNCLFIIRMEKLTPLTPHPEQVMKIALDIAYALQYVHNAGIVHCDVKPDNFFLSADGICKLGDFNISGYQGTKRSVSGSHGYIAPEVFTDTVYDPRSDIFSYGISLNQLTKGRCSPDFMAIISKACSHDVSARYQSFDDIISDISLLKNKNIYFSRKNS